MQSELHLQLVGDAFLTPQWFSSAIGRMSRLSSVGIGCRPGRDFPLQRSLKPARCQRIRVCGRTTTRAERHANSRDSSAKLTRVAPSIRLGFTPRSTSRDSCRRRNRTSASSARPDRESTRRLRSARPFPCSGSLGAPALPARGTRAAPSRT